MTKYCIAWKLTKARGGEVYTGPPLLHPEYIAQWAKRNAYIPAFPSPEGTPLTKKEAKAKAQRMNLATEFPSHHWVIQYKGREWKKINQALSTQTVSKEE